MDKERRDPGQRMEQLWAERLELLEQAKFNEALGLKYVAQACRRSAAGKLAAYNAMARRL